MAGFTPEQRQALAGFGEGVAGALRDRFNRKQLDDFLQSEYAEYKQSLFGLQAAMLDDPDNEDLVSQTLQQYSKQTHDLMTLATSKYAKNPYIVNVAQMHLQHDNTMLDEIVGKFEATGARARAPEERERTEETRQAELSRTRGQATQAEEAGLLDRERRLHPEKFRAAGSQTREPHPLIPQGVPIGEAVRALMTTASKAAGDYRREKIGSLKADMARNRLESLHETDKGGGLKWNKNDPEDLKAMIGTVSDEQATDMFILQELALARYSIEEIKMAYPSIIDDRLMGERDVVPSLAGEQPTRIIVGSMLGDRGITALDTLEVNTEDLTTVVNNLPDDLSDLGEDGPLQSVFFTAWDSGGLVPGGDKRQKFENYRDFVTWLRTFSEEKIRTYIGGWDAEDRALDKQTVRSRDQARMLRDAMIKKYGAHIARQLGLQGAPKRKQHTTLLGKMGEAAGGLLRGFTAEEEIE